MNKFTILFLLATICCYAEPAYDIILLRDSSKPSDETATVSVLTDNGDMGGSYEGNAFIYSVQNGFEFLNVPALISYTVFLTDRWAVGVYSDEYFPDEEDCRPFIYDRITKELHDPLEIETEITAAYPIGIFEDTAIFKITESDNDACSAIFYDVKSKSIRVITKKELSSPIAINTQGQLLTKSKILHHPLPQKSRLMTLNDKGDVAGITENKVFFFNVVNPKEIIYSDQISTKVEKLLLNNQGKVVGTAGKKAFFFDPSHKKVQWIQKSGNEIGLHGLNDCDQSVGYISASEQKMEAMRWSPQKGIEELKNLIPKNKNWKKLLFADQINNQGWITGTGIYKDGIHGFLLIPKE